MCFALYLEANSFITAFVEGEMIVELKRTTCFPASLAAFNPFTIEASMVDHEASSPFAKGVCKRAESYRFNTEA